MNFVLKQIEPFSYIGARKTTRLVDMPGAAEEIGAICGKLEQAAIDGGLGVPGPIVHIYNGVDANPETVIELIIAAPITTPASDATVPEPFFIAEAPPATAVTYTHLGSMSGIGEAWSQLSRYTSTLGRTLTGVSREVYAKWVDCDSPENVTELQIIVE